MKKIKLISVILFIGFTLNAQTNMKGSISDETNQPLSFVNIVLQDSLDVIVSYTYSSEKGLYSLRSSKKGNFKLKFSSLGFRSKVFFVNLSNNKEIIKNIILTEEAFSLDEVIIQSEKIIKIKKDTIEIKANSYLTENDATIEDLLKKIPGVTVNSEGTIKIGNKEIEKLMIDGDDFFDRGYKILSKNMPPDQIEKIQLLQKYSNNKLLKGIEESDQVALNLVLKDNAKRKWFGNLSLGYDVTFNKSYNLKSYLMNFGKKNKYIFLTNFNNIGYNATGDINHLIHPFRYGEPASIGDNQSAYSLLNFNSFIPNFKASRTNFNNTELASLNAIFTLSKKVKLKTIGFFNWDENDFFRSSITSFTSSGTNFTNTENFVLRKKKTIGFGKIDLNYTISKTKTLEFTTKYNNQDKNSNSNLIFNDLSTLENLKSKNTLFDQKITFTNKFKDTKVFLLTGRYINEKISQNYIINQFFYENLFSNFSNANNVIQQSENKMQFAGFNAHLLDKKENGNLLELQFGNEFRSDKLNSTFTVLEDTTVLETPSNFQNNTTYQTNNLYVKAKYRVKIKDVALIGKLDFHQLFNVLENNSFSEKQHPFYINPSIGFDWEINKKNKIISSYSYNTTNARIIDVYNNYVLRSVRLFSKGTGGFNQLDASSLILNYQLGNWSDIFFVNTSIIYNKKFDFFSTNSIITQNYTQSEKITIKDRESFTVFTDINKYFKIISSNFKIKASYTKLNYKNVVNNSGLREVKSTNYNYSFGLRSGFQGVFNYHLGSKWTTSQIRSTISNSFTNNINFLDLLFDINDKFNFQIQTERYFFENIDAENSTYYFADLEVKYKLKNNKLILSLSGKNLFNTKKFSAFSISDISTSTTAYRLLPRYVLLKMEYRF
ncbi:MAG: hypothetical protein COB60_06355 [Flavobacteriaceae bacterium]|nr:MAG: hypothetical protein COB60_06355 [Flavobacteriaceae bacterium]